MSDRTWIRGGLVYDGTGSAPQRADVLIEAGRVAAVGQGIDAADADILDASGMAVTPGFIDMHRHCDTAVLTDADFGTLELAQGITTTVVGNCGLAPVPTSDAHRQAVYDFLGPVTGDAPRGRHFARYGDYREALNGVPKPLHMGFLAALGAVKMAVKGFAQTPYTDAEMHAALRHMDEAVEAGVLGASVGIMYQPECYSTPAEIAALLAPAAAHDGLLCSHIRGEGDSLVASVAEIIDIAARAGIRLNISHFKATGIHNWRDTIFAGIDRIEAARARGQDVTVDFYPYDGGATTLQSLIPPCVLMPDNAQTLHRLSTAEGKRAMRDAVHRTHEGWDNMALSIGWDRILISSTQLAEHAAWQGRDIASLALAEGYGEPSDFVCDLLASEQGKVGIVVLSMDMRDVETVAQLPYAALISDALYGGGGNPHPRLYGAFARFLRMFCVEKSILPLETAIHKMTGLPAERLRLTGRGVLRPGAVADINVFDPGVFCDHATYVDAKREATGMAATYVAGRLAWRAEKRTGVAAGELLTPFGL